MRLYTMSLCLGLLPLSLLAQPKWEGGFYIGGTIYQGDLAGGNLPDPTTIKAAYGLNGHYFFNEQWSLRLALGGMQWEGSDIGKGGTGFQARQFNFTAQAGQAEVGLRWEPLGKKRYPASYTFRRIASPYLFASGGLQMLDVHSDFQKNSIDQLVEKIAGDQASDYPQWHPILNFGLGFKQDFTPRTALSLDIGVQTAFSDYLDGVSQSGNPDKKDWISFARLGLVIRFTAKDSDKDGIADEEDACPLISGAVSAYGCPDTDGDGVEDLEDVCPSLSGLPKLNGCPDSDLDGLADWEDDCPQRFGSLKAQGCPDRDGDTLADYLDCCPGLAGSLFREGCPLFDRNGNGLLEDEPIISIKPDANFLAHLAASAQQINAILTYYSIPEKKAPVEEEWPADQVDGFGSF